MDLSSTSPTSTSPLSLSTLSRSMPEVPGSSLSGSFTSHNGFAVGSSSVDSVTPTALSVIGTSPGVTPPSSPEKREIAPRVSATYLANNFATIEHLKSSAGMAKSKTEEKARLKEEFAGQEQKRREKLEETLRQLEEQMRLAKEQFTSETQVAQGKFDEKRHLINEERRKELSECKKKEKYIDTINAHLIERSKVLLPFLDIQRIFVRAVNENFNKEIAKMQSQVESRLTEAVENADALPKEIMTRVQILGKLYYLEQQMASYQSSKVYLMPDSEPPTLFAKECLDKRHQQLKDALADIQEDIKKLSVDNKSPDVFIIKKLIETRLSSAEIGLSHLQSKKFTEQKESPNKLVDSIFKGEDIPTLQGTLNDFNQFVQQFHALRALLDVEAVIQTPLSKVMIEKQAQQLKDLQKVWNEKCRQLLGDIDAEKKRVKAGSLQLTQTQEELNKTYEDMNSTIKANSKKQPVAPTEKKGGLFGIFGKSS